MQLIQHLSTLDYPGRGLVLGLMGERPLGVYFVTARSAASKAKTYTLSADQKSISVQTTNLKIMARGKLDLLQYTSVRLGNEAFVLGNGRQVDAVELGKEGSAEERLTQDLAGWSYEDDAYHTPRITGLISSAGGSLSAALHIIRSNEIGTALSQGFEVMLAPQKASLITTYRGENVRPTPAFQGEPVSVELEQGSLPALVQAVYEALAPKDNKEDLRVSVVGIALQVETWAFETHILNTFI